MGWSELFGSNCKKGWKYLAEAYKRWEWLSPIFGTELEYRTSLVAYYMALHIHELASIIASDQPDTFRFNVPLTFVSEGYDINQLAISLLLRDPASLTKLWTSLNVTREQMEHSWGNWIRLSETLVMGNLWSPHFTRKFFISISLSFCNPVTGWSKPLEQSYTFSQIRDALLSKLVKRFALLN